MSKIHPNATIVTPVNSGTMGITSKVKLPSGAIYFAKVVSAEKFNTKIISQQNRKDAEIIASLKNYAEIEFLLLELMNLIGLKTPTELALLQYDKGALLIKRAAANGEEKNYADDNDITDNDHKTRFETFVEAMSLADISDNNVITTTNAQQKNHNVTIDLLLSFSSTPKFNFNCDETRALQKLVYFYEKNPDKINGILTKIDHLHSEIKKENKKKLRHEIDEAFTFAAQTFNNIIQTYFTPEALSKLQKLNQNYQLEKNQIIGGCPTEEANIQIKKLDEELYLSQQQLIQQLPQDNKDSIVRASMVNESHLKKSKADLETKLKKISNSEIPSKKFTALIDQITEKATKFKVEKYQPKADGKYKARNVPAELNTENLELIFTALKKQSDLAKILPDSLDHNQVSVYSAFETFKSDNKSPSQEPPSNKPQPNSLSSLMQNLRNFIFGK